MIYVVNIKLNIRLVIMKVINLYDESLDVIEKVVLREISRRTLKSDVDVIYKWKTM